ncbi:MAG: hypothetical protein JWM80_116 [Cyanobacteria bacterium RYN_339]|nr:hypothetical protein [Cyanobacteria bacterium RYN_339]
MQAPRPQTPPRPRVEPYWQRPNFDPYQGCTGVRPAPTPCLARRASRTSAG